MLRYWKNGKEIILNSIGKEGVIGQLVILGEQVDWGTNPNPKEFPLSQYPCPSVFTIVDYKEDFGDGYYVLQDYKARRIKVRFNSSINYLYTAQEWLAFNAAREAEKLARKQRKIEQLEGHVDLLKDILIKQGTRIVTEEQAKKLGINA